MAGTLALLFHRGGEGVVARARTAAGRALALRLCGIPEIDRVVVATRSPFLWEDLPVEIVPDPPGYWHFGTRLAELVERLRPARLLYFSSGSGFLLNEETLERLATTAPARPPYAVLNNFYSTDFGLITPPAPQVLKTLERDNSLGTRLWDAGYQCFELPRSAATQLDIDTPGELQLLALRSDLPTELKATLSKIPTDRAKAIVGILSTLEAELLLVGRVGGGVFALLEREAACRVRLFSEERGMRASGRLGRGEVKSLLATLPGPAALVERLAELADGVVWDTRVYLAAAGLRPLPSDRFACDLLCLEEITTPLLKELAQACLDARVPFLLGGHSLVSGGMYLAVELAWGEKRDLPSRWRPLPFSG